MKQILSFLLITILALSALSLIQAQSCSSTTCPSGTLCQPTCPTTSPVCNCIGTTCACRTKCARNLDCPAGLTCFSNGGCFALPACIGGQCSDSTKYCNTAVNRCYPKFCATDAQCGNLNLRCQNGLCLNKPAVACPATICSGLLCQPTCPADRPMCNCNALGNCQCKSTCTTNAQCSPGTICAGGNCITPIACSALAPCEPYETCTNGLCIPNRCTNNGDCFGELCQLGACVPLPIIPCNPNTCTGIFCPSQCPVGRDVCACGKAGTVCTCTPRCAVDADCKAGEVCAGGVCALAEVCSSNADCLHPGTRCVSGRCRPIPCTVNRDCGSPLARCEANGFCLEAPAITCDPLNNQCQAPLGFCHCGGKGGVRCNCSPQCVTAIDCAAGQRCDFGTCV